MRSATRGAGAKADDAAGVLQPWLVHVQEHPVDAPHLERDVPERTSATVRATVMPDSGSGSGGRYGQPPPPGSRLPVRPRRHG